MVDQKNPGTELRNIFHIVAGQKDGRFPLSVVRPNELPNLLLHDDV